MRIWRWSIWKWFKQLVDVREGRMQGVRQVEAPFSLSVDMAILDSRRLGVEVE